MLRLLGTKEAERLTVLMQRLGFALWQLQALENAVASYVVVRLHDTRGVGVDRGAEVSADVEGLVLGKLVGQLTNAGVIHPSLAAPLKAILDERNWLVHRLWREYHGVISDPDTYARLLERLGALADDALELSKELAEQMEGFVVSSGVNRDFINTEAERLAKAWGLLD